MSGGTVWLRAEAELPPFFSGMEEEDRQRAAYPPESRKQERAEELWIYREKTLALLRRYMRMSVETGRLPSLLGREFFRTRVRSYHVRSFEDIVIFVHDIERCLERLTPFHQEIVARLVLQEYSQQEMATRWRCCRQTIGMYLDDALDATTEMLLDLGLMEPLIGCRNSCQVGKNYKNGASV